MAVSNSSLSLGFTFIFVLSKCFLHFLVVKRVIMSDKTFSPFIPRNDFGVIKPVPAETGEGSVRSRPLNLSVHALETRGHKFTLRDAFREILQNTIDGVVQANGNSHEGLQVACGDSIRFHNGKYMFGYITETDTQIKFVNYGPHITNIHHVINFGASQKKSRSQVGQHGEGLKRAALCFLLDDFEIHAIVPINQKGTRKAHLWRLQFTVKDDELFVSCTPKTSKKQDLGYHRFEVTIEKGIHRGPGRLFRISDYMIKDLALLREPNSGPAIGSLLIKEPGALYVWHFNVVPKKAPSLYGYDLLNVDHISRDRNWVDRDDAVTGIAAIWSIQIVRDPVMRDLFFRQVFANPEVPETVYEKQAIANLHTDALQLLTGMCVKPGQVHFLHHAKIPADFREEFFVRLPASSFNAIDRRNKCSEWLNRERTQFKGEPAFHVKLKPDAAALLKEAGIDELSVVFGYKGSCKWFMHDRHFRVSEAILENACILENNSIVKWKSFTTFWQTLLFDIFPHITVDPKPFFRILAAPSCQTPPPPPPPAPPAPVTAPVTRASAAARKRTAEEEEVQEEEEEEETAPKRYKPYTGPQLYVLE